MNFCLPFYHLSSSPFWKIIDKNGQIIPPTKNKSIKSFNILISLVDYAEIDKELLFYLNRKEERNILRQAIINKYFFNIQPLDLSSTYYLDEVAEQILRDSGIQYKKTINHLKENQDEENFDEEVFIRRNVFRDKIPQIYDYTCCITGLKVVSNNNYSMIDACHIVPFSVSHDDTIGNGLALCPNLHRAFDTGLITIDNNYRIVVSNKFVENDTCTHSIRQFENKELMLPNNKIFHPRKEVIIWHNENVFEKNL